MLNELDNKELREMCLLINELTLSLKMNNNWINLIQNPSGMSVDDRAFHYMYAYESLGDVFEINQSNIDKLNLIASFLDGLNNFLE